MKPCFFKMFFNGIFTLYDAIQIAETETIALFNSWSKENRACYFLEFIVPFDIYLFILHRFSRKRSSDENGK